MHSCDASSRFCRRTRWRFYSALASCVLLAGCLLPFWISPAQVIETLTVATENAGGGWRKSATGSTPQNTEKRHKEKEWSHRVDTDIGHPFWTQDLPVLSSEEVERARPCRANMRCRFTSKSEVTTSINLAQYSVS